MKKVKVPKSLQGILWSVDTQNLDVQKDQGYIINQVLAYGTSEHLKWLFQTYSEEQIKNVFTTKPQKIYSPADFNWVTTVLLKGIKIPPSPERYVKDLPRNTG